ncbi:MAG: xanthine dehydrogenase family protein molybdopterin-binding subunit [Gammaproteobacteria bacterium]|nr:xanthine dehydrogenase family protein molybdopterin-binding subunit [Gammaproteobacteria bacterium]
MSISRRTFLKTAGIAGGGLIIGVVLTRGDGPALPIKKINGALQANAFIQVTPDNVVRFYLPRDEMGQGAIMGLATLVAEELDVHPAQLDIEFAGVHPDYNNPDFGVQGTGGSTSIKAHYRPLREAAATVREVLLSAAAQDLGVARTDLSIADGHVVHSRESYPYGQFTATAATLELPETVALKPKAEFKYIGADIARVDALAKSTGTAVYGIDVDLPGMHYAVVQRCPVAGGTVKRVATQAALAMPGVTDVLQIENGVAVVAERYWQAHSAAKKLEVEWLLPELLSGVDTKTVEADYQQALISSKADESKAEGDLDAGFAAAVKTVQSEFWTPYLAHAPLEPMNAVVSIEDDHAEVWSGTQGPQITQGLVARYAGVPKENVRVHGVYLGGGFGRRGYVNYVAEATQVARAANKPIKLIWSREDDMRHGVYRPASLMQIKAGVSEDGKISAWHATRVGANLIGGTMNMALPGILPTAVPKGVTNFAASTVDSIMDGWAIDHVSVEGLEGDYDFDNMRVDHITKDHGVPTTYWRSVGHSFTAFAKETMIDELAQQAGVNEVEFRINNTQRSPRIQNVIRRAGAALAALGEVEGRSVGFAAHGSFNSYVAQAAEVSVSNGQIKVHRVVCVVDCGQVINPDIVKGQMEGAIMFGLTAALHGNVDIEKGAIKQSNFHDYPILRMDEAPVVDVIIIDSDEDPTGVGEPGLPPIAPAVANAVYKATGQRLRSLPLKLA